MTRILLADDYNKIARDIVDKFMKQATTLEDGVVNRANDMELNPDQIKNLVHAANTLAHLALMDQKADGDKVVEFDPADPDVVMKRIYIKVVKSPESASAPVSSSASSSMVDHISDMFGDVPKSDSAAGMLPNPDAAPAEEENQPRRSVLIMRIQKVAEELNNQKREAAWQYKDQLDKLASDFASLYGPQFEEFEKDAFDVYGEGALPLLADLRRCLRMDAPSSQNFVKTAEIRVVDSKNPQMCMFANMLKLAKTFTDCSAGMAYLQKEAGEYL